MGSFEIAKKIMGDVILVHKLFEKSAVQNGDRICIKFNEQELSYSELNISSNQLAHFLTEKGVKKGDVIGLFMDRSINSIISMLAILKIGGVYLPLDSSYPKERIEFMLEDSSSQFILTDFSHQHKIQFLGQSIFIEEFYNSKMNFSPNSPETIDINDYDLIYILYTSGSTGMPKGVMMEHRNLVNYLNSISKVPGINESDRILGMTTFSFDISALEIYLPLINGAQLILLDDEKRKDGRYVLDTIVNEKITIVQATPSTYRNLYEIGWQSYIPVKAFCSGEPMNRDLVEKLCPLCDELWNMYGPTETTIHSTIKKMDVNDGFISIGKAIDNTYIYILDENQQKVKEGEEGEIVISGLGVSRGYLNRADLNSEKFLEDNYSKQAKYRMYRTGDLGKILPNGEIFYAGRQDHQVKLRGFRIELEEIEYVLNKLDNIGEAIVSSREDLAGNPRLVAYLVLNKLPDKINKSDKYGVIQHDFKLEIENWKNKLAEKLPEFMIPSNFVILNYFPKTESGKIDRKALPKPAVIKEFEKPQQNSLNLTYEENLILEIWSDLLNLRKIQLSDNFFELGGNSLIAIQVLNRIEKILGIRLQLSILFEHPTIEQLALLLKSDKKLSQWKSLVPIKPFGNKIPLYSVHGGGLGVFVFKYISNYLDKNQPVYGLQALGINGIYTPLESIEEMADFYIHEILQQNPDGPYFLAGHSAGGIVAYEMAKRLIKMGKEVKFLGIFDYDLYEAELYNSNKKRRYQLLFKFFPRLFFTIKSAYLYPNQTWNHIKTIWKLRYRSFMKLLGFEKKDSYEGIYLHIMNSMQKFDEALKKYKLEPYDGVIDIFVSKIKVYYHKDPEYLGWKPYGLKGIIRHEVPGDHDDMILPPNDKIFAKILQERLNNC